MPLKHKCDERCICPIHRTPLIYAPGPNEHACQDIDCTYGHGLETVLMRQLLQARIGGSRGVAPKETS
jgi:hypothetical protein